MNTPMQQAWVSYKRRAKLSPFMALRTLFVAGWMAHAAIASAGGYPPLTMSDSGDTCYTWEGGRGSAGSFTKCSPQVSVAAAPKLPPPVVASPVMMPMSAPVTCVPPQKPIVKHKARPAPKKC